LDIGPVSARKKVFVLTSAPPEGGGGVEHFIRELVKGLEEKGYAAQVFHQGNSAPPWAGRQTGRLGKKLVATLCGYWTGKNAQRHMGDDVAAVISNSDAGYYPLHGPTPFRKVQFYHGTYRGQAEAIRPFIKYGGYLYMKWWSSMVLERASGRGKTILANSEQVREEVLKFFGQSSTAMWLPMDLGRFKPGDRSMSRRSLKLPIDAPVGLFVGSTHPMKGFGVIRSLIERLPEVHWVLVLRGDLPRDLIARPNVTMLSDVPHDQLPELYGAADFSVCPSLYEPFGYVVAESLTCGTPAIASPGGASRLFLREPPVDRLLVARADGTEEFLAAVREVLRDPGFYRRAVIERVRPRIEELMAPANWWRRFFEVTQL
jgi:glycosyltransferase involved in cell wall biosynthesis